MFEDQEEKIAERFLQEGLIDESQLEQARKSGIKPLHRALIEMDLLSKDQIYEFIADQLQVAYIDLESYAVDEEALAKLPEALGRQFKAVPIFALKDSLGVAMADPRNVEAIDRISMRTGLAVEPFLSAEEDIIKVLEKYYHDLGSVEEMIEDLEVTRLQEEEEEIPELKDLSEEAPITRLVNLILAQGVRDGASDIHIEPDDKTLRIRFRIDGILYEVPSPPKRLKAAITSRIKVMANLNIAETRRPQDGHIRMRIEGKNIDIRVSLLPTVFGENVVLRVLNPESVAIGLDNLGFSPKTQKIFEDIIFRPHGIFLNTGPTGSGKTTTLYAALQSVNSVEKNIITVEDPVEYRLQLIRQVQVNPRAGVTFANGLRAILRQDPDIIMIGEIRGVDTAEIAVQAALTGHFVFSTLHTNDAVGAVPRMIHMGVEPFLVAASLEGIMAQRLLRKICPACRQAYEPLPAVLKQLNIDNREKVVFYRGEGCEQCRGTGYKGRTAVAEIIDMSSVMRQLVLKGAGVEDLREQARKQGTVFMEDEALQKVLDGITTVEEMTRVTGSKVDLGIEDEDKPAEETPELVPLEITEKEEAPPGRLEAKDIDDYQEKITHWLSR